MGKFPLAAYFQRSKRGWNLMPWHLGEMVSRLGKSSCLQNSSHSAWNRFSNVFPDVCLCSNRLKPPTANNRFSINPFWLHFQSNYLQRLNSLVVSSNKKRRCHLCFSQIHFRATEKSLWTSYFSGRTFFQLSKGSDMLHLSTDVFWPVWVGSVSRGCLPAREITSHSFSLSSHACLPFLRCVTVECHRVVTSFYASSHLYTFFSGEHTLSGATSSWRTF